MRVPWREVAGIAGAVVVLLLVVAPRYGWHRDELYFLQAGKHLAWGYVDQPPFTPLVARLADVVAPGNLVVLRLLPALATAATIVLGALLARELGATRGGVVAAAGVVAAGGFLLGAGHLLSTATFDLTAWMALLVVTARLLRTDDPRWWGAFGAVAGVSLLNKNLLVLLVGGLLAGLVVERRRRLLLSPWLAAGALFALAIAAPNLIWQANHSWPQLEMAKVLSRRLATSNRVQLVPLQFLLVGPAFVGLMWQGARFLARDPRGQPLRALLWAWPAGLALIFATGGRPYYALPFTLAVTLAGVAAVSQRGPARPLLGLIVPNAVISALIALPILPVPAVKVTEQLNEAVAETVGWPQMVDEVAAVVRGLPAADRAHVVLLAASYGEAGALDRFGPARGLPHAYSPHNSYADFRQPHDDHATVVAVRYRLADLEPFFRDCRQVARVDNHAGIENEAQGVPILVCHDLRQPWDVTWKALRFYA